MGRQTSKPGKKQKAVLTVTQCRAMLSNMSATDRALFIGLLLCGSKARTWTWEGALDQVLELPMAVYDALRALAAAKQLTLFPFNFAGFTRAHWARGVQQQSPIFTSPISEGKPWTTQEATRRLKRYARLAGLNECEVNLRTVLNTHRWLVKCYGSAEDASDVVCPMERTPADRSTRGALTVSWVTRSQDPRLHGIGRRSSRRQ